jgi:hypothetical protein
VIGGFIVPDSTRSGFWPTNTIMVASYYAHSSWDSGDCGVTMTWSGSVRIDMR